MASRPPLGIALADSLGPLDPAFRQQFSIPEQPATPKMSKGQLIMGILADALSGAAGQPGQFAASQRQRQQQEQEQAQWGLRRRADLEDYGRKLEMQNDPRYAKPEQRYWEDNAGNQWKLGADGKPIRFFTDMAPKQYIQDGMLVTAPNPYNSAAASSPPPVIDEDLWNTGKPLGGPTQPASGNFPRF